MALWWWLLTPNGTWGAQPWDVSPSELQDSQGEDKKVLLKHWKRCRVSRAGKRAGKGGEAENGTNRIPGSLAPQGCWEMLKAFLCPHHAFRRRGGWDALCRDWM